MFAPRSVCILFISGVLALPGLASAVDESAASDNSPRVDRFLQSLAESTATAKSRSNRDVKFVALSIDSNDQVVIDRLGIGKGHKAGYCRGEGVIAVAHVHHRLMSQGPDSADFDAVGLERCKTFIISSDGKRIWEVALRDGGKMYRVVGDPELPIWRSYD